MKLTVGIILLTILSIWLYAKWVQSRALRKVEREGNERAADDVRAAQIISEEVDEKTKDIAADDLDAMRKRMSGNDSTDS